MSHTSLDDDVLWSRQALESAPSRISEGASTHRELIILAHAIERRYAQTWLVSDSQERVALSEEVLCTIHPILIKRLNLGYSRLLVVMQ